MFFEISDQTGKRLVVSVRLNYRQRAVVVITSVAKLQLILFAISKKTFTTERKKNMAFSKERKKS